jgi:hypothetical protein
MVFEGGRQQPGEVAGLGRLGAGHFVESGLGGSESVDDRFDVVARRSAQLGEGTQRRIGWRLRRRRDRHDIEVPPPGLQRLEAPAGPLVVEGLEGRDDLGVEPPLGFLLVLLPVEARLAQPLGRLDQLLQPQHAAQRVEDLRRCRGDDPQFAV